MEVGRDRRSSRRPGWPCRRAERYSSPVPSNGCRLELLGALAHAGVGRGVGVAVLARGGLGRGRPARWRERRRSRTASWRRAPSSRPPRESAGNVSVASEKSPVCGGVERSNLTARSGMRIDPSGRPSGRAPRLRAMTFPDGLDPRLPHVRRRHATRRTGAGQRPRSHRHPRDPRHHARGGDASARSWWTPATPSCMPSLFGTDGAPMTAGSTAKALRAGVRQQGVHQAPHRRDHPGRRVAALAGPRAARRARRTRASARSACASPAASRWR